MHYCISIFAVTPQNYAGHITEEGENELIMKKGKVMKNEMMRQGEERERRSQISLITKERD
jgi:hypothetical protein